MAVSNNNIIVRANILTEILESESNYVDTLCKIRNLINQTHQKRDRLNILSFEDFEGTLTEIQSIHENLLHNLEKAAATDITTMAFGTILLKSVSTSTKNLNQLEYIRNQFICTEGNFIHYSLVNFHHIFATLSSIQKWQRFYEKNLKPTDALERYLAN